MSFKVTDFHTNRKPVCDFLLRILCHFRVLQIIDQIDRTETGRREEATRYNIIMRPRGTTLRSYCQ